MKFVTATLLLAIAVTAVNCSIFSFFGSKKNGEKYNFETLPNHKDYPRMARFIVHNSNWTSVAYRSLDRETYNLSLATIFSTADGPISNGTGVPYFYLTEHEPSVNGLMRGDKRCGLMMSLAQSNICDKNKWDAEDPRCARVFLIGRLEKLAEKTAEYEFAKKSFTARHPLFVGMPSAHNFFYAKYNIENITLISGVGGVRYVTLKDYFSCKSS